MIWAVAAAVGVTGAAGVYLALSRDLVRCVLGLSLLGSAVNLVVFATGRLGSAVPPLGAADGAVPPGAANPVPQALVLTAIVIGFALTCLSLVLVVRLLQATRVQDAHALRVVEPPSDPADPVRPPLEEEP